MKIIIRNLFLFTCIALSMSLHAAAQLDKDSIMQFMGTMDKLAIEMNADAIAGYLSDDIKITMNISLQGQTQVLKPSKQEYLQMLKQGWAVAQNYSYKRENVKINIVEKGRKAVVTADVIESMTIQGQDITGKSTEEAVVELVNGKLLITAVSGKASM